MAKLGFQPRSVWPQRAFGDTFVQKFISPKGTCAVGPALVFPSSLGLPHSLSHDIFQPLLVEYLEHTFPESQVQIPAPPDRGGPFLCYLHSKLVPEVS